jgi:cell division protein FtsL
MRAVAMGTAIAALFTGAGVLHTCIRVAVLDEAYKLSTIETEHRALSRENEQLRVEAATLRSPGRIEPLAKSLGLERPQPAQVIAVRPAARGLKDAHAERPRIGAANGLK